MPAPCRPYSLHGARVRDYIEAQTINYQLYSLQKDIRQYENCSCDAIPESCGFVQTVATRCLPTPWPMTILLISLGSYLEYIPGETYYLTCKPEEQVHARMYNSIQQ